MPALPISYSLVVNELIGLIIPTVKFSDFGTDLFGRMFGSQLSHSLEMNLFTCRRHIKQEFLGKGSVLNILEDLLHRLFGFFRDDLRSGNVIAVLGGIGNGISHSRSACR